MGDALPVVPGHALVRPLTRSGHLYVATSSAGDAETVEVTDVVTRPSGVALALAARERAAQQRVTSDHLLRLREVIPLGHGAVALVRDPADGGTLADLVDRRGRLLPGEVTTLLAPLAATLAELDTAGVVHGALHPGSVLFTQQGKPLLSGFDVVRLVGEQHRHPRWGSPGFEAPEVVLGALPTPASDAWSLGAIGWYALTGGLPPVDAVDLAAEVLGAAFAEALAPLLEHDPARRPRAGTTVVGTYRAAAAVPLQLGEPAPVPPPEVKVRGGADLEDLEDLPDVESPGAAPGAGVAGTAPGSAALVEDPWEGQQRVRTAWGEDPDALPPAQGPTASADQAAGTRTQAAADPDTPHRSRSTGRRALVLALAVVLFVGAFVVVLTRRPPVGQAGGVPAAAPATAVAVAVSGADPTAQGEASPAQILQGLVDARAAAVTARSASRLDRAELPASAPYVADAALIARLTGASQSYAGLRFVVRDVVVRARTDTRMELTAVVARDGYALVAGGGGRSPQPGTVGEAYGYQLTRTPSGWRLSSLTVLTGLTTTAPSAAS